MRPSRSCVCTLDVWPWSRPIQSSQVGPRDTGHEPFIEMFEKYVFDIIQIAAWLGLLLFVRFPQRGAFGEIEKSTWPKVTTKPNKWT